MDSSIYRIASFNCKSIKRSVDNVRMLCQSCDLIALQETWLLPDEITYLNEINSEFTYTGISAVDTSAGILRGRPYGGVAILWRSSVFQQVSVLPCDNNRICAIKIITSERPIIIISIYMPTNSFENLPEFTDCLNTVSAIIDEYNIDSVFVLGDYNADLYELFFNELLFFCNEQCMTCIDIDLLGIDSGSHTFVSDAHGTCSWLDHCLVTQSAKEIVTSVSIQYDALWSDHFPLIIECDMLCALAPKRQLKTVLDKKDILWNSRNQIQIQKYINVCAERIKLIDFPVECINCANYYCNDIGHRIVLDRLYSDIVAALRDASLAGRGDAKAGGARRHIFGWNRQVADAHRNARMKLKEWMWGGRPRVGILYDEMNISRRVFKSRLKWCQNHQDQIKMDAIAKKHSNGDFSGFWKSTKINAKPSVPVSLGGLTDHRDIANSFMNHFAANSALNGCEDVYETDLSMRDIGFTVTAKMVTDTIKNMTRGKSPGHDGLSIEHLQHAGPHISRVLAMLYSLCLSHSYLPEDFMRTVVIPVPKNKNGDMSDKSNYRPISLATIIAKVFDGVLNTQLNNHIKLHDNQFGFRPNLSTESAILCLKHTTAYYTRRKTPVYACFLDLSRAFDLVVYDKLWRKLQSEKLQPELINILKYWYEHQVNHVRWAGTMSDSYRLNCGVRQGGLTSPTLFNLYVNALIGELSGMHVGCHIDGVCLNNLSYADDMVLLSASICGLTKLLRVCEDYARSHGLRYNVCKSQFMIFEARGTICPEHIPPVCLNGVPLKRVHYFKYLGHIVTASLSDDVDIERERKEVSKRANMIARRFARCSAGVKITLFKAYCTSLYTCSLWANFSKKCYNVVKTQYNNAFRVVMGLPRFCSASSMFAIAHTDCFCGNLRKRSASLVRRIRASSNTILAMIAQKVDCPYIRRCCDLQVLRNAGYGG